MQRTVYPLRNGWKVNEDSAVHATEQIQQRVDSEDWYTHCKGYPLIRTKDIKHEHTKQNSTRTKSAQRTN